MAKLVFSAPEVRRIIEYGRGKKHPTEQYGTPIRAKEFIYLVHDEGVYIMSGAEERFLTIDDAGKPKSIVAYAKGCSPKDPDYWDVSRDLVGGDDFAEIIPIGNIPIPASAIKLHIDLTETQIKVQVEVPR